MDECVNAEYFFFILDTSHRVDSTTVCLAIIIIIFENGRMSRIRMRRDKRKINKWIDHLTIVSLIDFN